jgi:SAM-dependent methyltransferase
VRQVTIPGTGESFDLERPGQVAAWNRALNRRYAMENLRAHPNRVVRWIEARRRRRIAALVPAGFDRAVDVGAEDGSLAGLWRDKGRLTLLLDLDPTMLSGAPRPGAVADAEGLPLAEASVDIVVLSAVLEHVLDPRRAVAEAMRVLRPGGRLVVYVPWDKAAIALKRWARRIGIGLGELSEGSAPGHLRAFDRRELATLLGAGCRVRFDPFSLGYYAEVSR